MDLLEQIEKLLSERDSYIGKSLLSSTKKMDKANKELNRMIVQKYASDFETVGGKIIYSNKNLRLIEKIDNIFEEFSKRYSNYIFKDLGSKMLDMVVYSEEYFKLFGDKKTTLEKIAGKMDLLSKRIGVTKEGELIKGSYLDRLAKAPQFKEELKNYVAKGLSEETTLKEFQSGFSDLINGSKDVDGKMLRYWKTETHDSFFAVSRAEDDIFAQQLKMSFFIYLPGKIKHTRPFCLEKVGKCFHRLDAKKWANEEWAGKKTPYNPLVDMGGWNCRHSPAWINNGTAKRMYPEKYNEYKDILK